MPLHKLGSPTILIPAICINRLFRELYRWLESSHRGEDSCVQLVQISLPTRTIANLHFVCHVLFVITSGASCRDCPAWRLDQVPAPTIRQMIPNPRKTIPATSPQPPELNNSSLFGRVLNSCTPQMIKTTPQGKKIIGYLLVYRAALKRIWFLKEKLSR